MILNIKNKQVEILVLIRFNVNILLTYSDNSPDSKTENFDEVGPIK